MPERRPLPPYLQTQSIANGYRLALAACRVGDGMGVARAMLPEAMPLGLTAGRLVGFIELGLRYVADVGRALGMTQADGLTVISPEGLAAAIESRNVHPEVGKLITRVLAALSNDDGPMVSDLLIAFVRANGIELTTDVAVEVLKETLLLDDLGRSCTCPRHRKGAGDAG